MRGGGGRIKGERNGKREGTQTECGKNKSSRSKKNTKLERRSVKSKEM